MEEATYPLEVQSIDFDDKQSYFVATWKGHSAKYVRRPYAKETITGELYLLREGDVWVSGEVRLRDHDGVVERTALLFDGQEVSDDDLPGGSWTGRPVDP